MAMTAKISEKIPKIAVVKTFMVKMGTDEVLFDKVKQDDNAAFESLFRTYYATLSHYACAILQDLDEAEEIVQDVFVKIWEKRTQLTIETSFKAYIYQSVKNKCLNHIRNKKTQNSHLTIIDKRDYESPNALTDLTADELNDKLYEAMEALPPKCKQIFQLSRLDGLKHAEIATQLDLKVKTIENQIGIALKFLRNHLADYLPTYVLLLLNFF
jgi:RNA polymerase sigma-70 factor, ECF subfamily